MLNGEDDGDSTNNPGVEDYDELRAYVKNRKQSDKNVAHASTNLVFTDQ